MTCGEIRALLDDWAAGRLAESEAGRVAEHLEGCAACRAEVRQALALAEATSGLPLSVEPARDLWPAIAPRLDGPAGRAAPWVGRLGARGLAAAAVVLVVLTATVTLLLAPAEKTAVPPAASATSDDLLRALEARDVSPRTMAVVQRNLAVIDAAVAELEAALAKDPGNQELARMLVSTHQKRAELVERAARTREDG